jgi:hypothetical protein
MSIASLLAIAKVLGVKSIMITDERLMMQMLPLWEKRDASKVHARRRASLSQVTLKRVMSPVAAELGRRGAAARNAKLGPEARRRLARAAARARWARWQGRD